MTIQTIREIVEGITTATISGICLSFWMIFIAEIWKWFFGVMKRALLNLFPGLKNLRRKSTKKKNDDRDLAQ